MTLIQRQSCRGVQSRVHNFSKTNRKVFPCVSVSLWWACPSNLYFGFFYKLFEAATLQQTESRRVPVNFEQNLRFLTENPKGNTFVPFRSLLPLLSKQYFSYFIETVVLAQPYGNDLLEMWYPGPSTQGLLMEP